MGPRRARRLIRPWSRSCRPAAARPSAPRRRTCRTLEHDPPARRVRPVGPADCRPLEEAAPADARCKAAQAPESGLEDEAVCRPRPSGETSARHAAARPGRPLRRREESRASRLALFPSLPKARGEPSAGRSSSDTAPGRARGPRGEARRRSTIVRRPLAGIDRGPRELGSAGSCPRADPSGSGGGANAAEEQPEEPRPSGPASPEGRRPRPAARGMRLPRATVP